EDGIRDRNVTGVQTCALPIFTLHPDRINEYNGVSDVVGAGLFRFATVVLILVVPLLTMRAFAEERKTGNLDLLRSAPLSLTALRSEERRVGKACRSRRTEKPT